MKKAVETKFKHQARIEPFLLLVKGLYPVLPSLSSPKIEGFPHRNIWSRFIGKGEREM